MFVPEVKLAYSLIPVAPPRYPTAAASEAIGAIVHAETVGQYLSLIAIIGAFTPEDEYIAGRSHDFALPEQYAYRTANIVAVEPFVAQFDQPPQSHLYEIIDRGVVRLRAPLNAQATTHALRRAALGLAAITQAYAIAAGYPTATQPIEGEFVVTYDQREAQRQRIKQRALVLVSGP